MVDRGPQHRQSEGGGHGAEEVARFGGDVPLVMVKGEDAVVLPLQRLVEDGVGADWANGINPLGTRGGHGGNQVLGLLGAEEATVAGVRVEGGDGNARRGEAESDHRLVDLAEHCQHALPRDVVNRLPQREVAREEEDAHLPGEEERKWFRGTQVLGQHLGVADVRHARGAQRL